MFQQSNRKKKSAFQKTSVALRAAIEHLEPRQLFAATIVGYEIGGASGGSPLAPAADTNTNLTAGNLSLGSGVAGSAAGNTFGGNNWDEKTSEATAASNGDYIFFNVGPKTNFAASFTTINAYNIRRSSTGPNMAHWQYVIDGTNVGEIGSTIAIGSTTSATGNAQAAIDLSGISALQSVGAGHTVTFRLVMWGDTGSGGTGYLNGTISGDDVSVAGTVTPVVSGTVENFKLDAATATVNKGNSTVITVDRDSSADTATAFITTGDGTATAGSDYTGVTNKEVDFASGQSQSSVTISTALSAFSADKTFTATLSNPSVTGTGNAAVPGTPTVETITIHDPRTVTVSQAFDNSEEVESGGTTDTKNGITYSQTDAYAEGTSGGAAHEAFTVLDFLNPVAIQPGTSVGALNSLDLATVDESGAFKTAGPVNVYIVTGTSVDVTNGQTAVTFQGSDGLNNQLGSEYLLGTINFTGNESVDAYTYNNLSLASADPTGLALLTADLNTGSQIRLVLTPGSASVAADYAGVNYTRTGVGLVPPQLRINYTYDSGTFSIAPITQSVNEGDGAATFTVTRSGGTTGAVDLDYHTADGTATAGSDYTGIPAGVLHFADGQTTGTITVNITDDTVAESDENFTVVLDSVAATATSGTTALGTPTSSTVTIVDNDAASLPVWLSPDSQAAYNSDTHVLTVTGAARIVADPGTDAAPIVTGDGSGAILTIAPTSDKTIHLGGITLTNGASVVVAHQATPADVITLDVNGAVSIPTPGDGQVQGTLDLHNNLMVVRYNPSADPTAKDDLTALAAVGFDGGDWLGAGLTSSDAANDANGNTAVGVIDNAELGLSSFGSVNDLNGNEVLIRYTYYGDADLSGNVDFDDVSQAKAGLNPATRGGTGWLWGDFDYNSSYDFDDFNLVKTGIQATNTYGGL